MVTQRKMLAALALCFATHSNTTQKTPLVYTIPQVAIIATGTAIGIRCLLHVLYPERYNEPAQWVAEKLGIQIPTKQPSDYSYDENSNDEQPSLLHYESSSILKNVGQNGLATSSMNAN